MRVSLIYATWPVTPFGVTWYKLADSLREAGLTQALVNAGHDVAEHVLVAEGASAKDTRGAFELAGEVARHCRKAAESGALPVIVCGSCAVASLGAMAGLNAERTGIFWMDAHPDLNTPDTSGSGLFDGMALATVLGKCWRQMAKQRAGLRPAFSRDVCLYGVRDIDPGETLFMTVEGIPVVGAAEEAVARLEECKRVYIHLDMDVHDALQVRSNTFAVPDGPSIEQVRMTLADIAANQPVAALSVTGLDPAAPDGALAMRTAIDHIVALCESRRAAKTDTR